MARPLAVIGFTYFLSLMLASAAGLSVSVLLALLLFVFFLFCLLLRPLRKKPALLAGLLAAVAAFAIFSAVEASVFRPLERAAGRTDSVTLMTTDEPYVTDTSRRYDVIVRESKLLPEGTRLYLWLSDAETAPEPYTLLTGEVELGLQKRQGLLSSARADGIVLQAWPAVWAGMTMTAADHKPWTARFQYLREEARRRIAARLPGEEGPLTAGICFGAKRELSEATTADFRGAGLSHLLAVSGLHTTLLAGAVLGLLRLLRVPKRLAALLSSGAVLFFMGLTGFSPSVMRAGMMCLVVLAGHLFRREADGLNSLGLALLLLSVPNVYAACDPGLLLSASATAGLLVLQPRIKGAVLSVRPFAGRQVLSGLVSPLSVSLSALLATTPVVALCFGEISLISPLSNLLAVPLGSLLMILGCLAVLLGGLPLLGPALYDAAGALAKVLLSLSHWLGNTFLSFISTRSPYLLLWFFAAGLLLFAGWRLLRGRGVRMAAALSAVLLTGGLLTNTLAMRGVTTVTALDAGNGAAVLLERDGRAALVVTGESAGGRMGRIGTMLKRRGIRQLDFLLFPDSNEQALFDIGLLLGRVEAARVLYDPDGKNAYQAEAFTREEQRLLLGETGVSFWDDCLLERRRDGWVRIRVGDTRLLLCPSAAKATALPPDWMQTNLVIYSQLPPAQAGILTVQAGVLSCREKDVSVASRLLPFAGYPVRMTARDGDVEAVTRGRGDVAFR